MKNEKGCRTGFDVQQPLIIVLQPGRIAVTGPMPMPSARTVEILSGTLVVGDALSLGCRIVSGEKHQNNE